MRLVKVPSLTRQLLAFSRRQVVQPRTIDINDIIRRVDSLLRRVIGEDIELHIELAPSPARRDRGSRTTGTGAHEPCRECARRDAAGRPRRHRDHDRQLPAGRRG